MRLINEVLGDKIVVNNIIKKGKCTIVNKNYVIKKGNDIKQKYDYLISRDFSFFPKLLSSTGSYNVFEYVEDLTNPLEQKALDMVVVLSNLHKKTTYYKDMDIDEYKKMFEDITNEIDYKMNYYNNLINNIELHMFQSPSEYLIARNISKILGALKYSKDNINKWYDLVKNSGKKRIVTLYNNMDLNHIIRNKNLYLISWDKSKNGMPIYDLYNFYNKYYNILDFNELLNQYEKEYKLLEDEKILLYSIISIPDVIEFSDNEVLNCKKVKRIIDYLYKSEVLISRN